MKYPVSINQEKRLLLEEYMRQHAVPIAPFNVAFGMSIEGNIQVEALTFALNAVIARHQGLRAAFMQNDDIEQSTRMLQLDNMATSGIFVPGMYVQHIKNDVLLSIRVENLDTFAENKQEHVISSMLMKSVNSNYNYNEPPLMRVHLFKLNQNKHVLILIISHLVLDMWSAQLLQREIQMLYISRVNCTSCELPQVQLHSTDYAVLQQIKCMNGEFDPAISYWQDQWNRFGAAQVQYRDMPAVLRRYGPGTSGVGVERVVLTSELLEEMRRFAKQYRTTIYMLLLSALAIILHRYVRKHKIALFCNYANRNETGYENTIGWFVNCHMIGIELPARITVHQVLSNVRLAVINAYKHQAVPLTYVKIKTNHQFNSSDLMLICDYMPYIKDHSPDHASARIRFTPLMLPTALMGNWHRGLRIMMIESMKNAELNAMYSKNQFMREGICIILQELAKTLQWFIRNPGEGLE